MNTPAIEAHALTKTFTVEGAPLHVLRGIDLTLPKGAFHAIMGPSGSGKSTLMGILAGLLSPTEGTITLDGTPLAGLSDTQLTRLRRRKLGIIFQDYNLVPTLTVSENIALPALLDGQTLPPERLAKLLELTGLTARKDHPANRISGGEAQRTAIARAFAMEPALILADEPTGNLDTPAARTLCQTLTQLNRELNTAILLISHDPQVAAAADTLHLLKDGAIIDTFATDHDPAAVSQRYLERMA